MASDNGLRTRHGFSMIELMVVVAVIGVVVMMAIPRIDVTRYRADAAGQLVRTLLQLAQRNAITRQTNVIVSFDATNHRIRIVQDANDNGAVDTGEDVKYRGLEEGAIFSAPTWTGIGGTTPGAAVIGNALATVDGMSSIIFRRDGSGSTNAEIYTTMRTTVRTEYRGLQLVGATGTMDLFRYGGSSWVRTTQ